MIAEISTSPTLQAEKRSATCGGWQVIDKANRIFGFDGWQRDGWGVTYSARVRVVIGEIVREGSGAGHGIDVRLGPGP